MINIKDFDKKLTENRQKVDKKTKYTKIDKKIDA